MSQTKTKIIVNGSKDKAEILQMISAELDNLDDFGQLQMHLKKHTGYYSNADIVKMTSVKFTDNEPNVTAGARIIRLIKGINDTNLTGSLSFTLKFDKGQAEQMLVQDFKKI